MRVSHLADIHVAESTGRLDDHREYLDRIVSDIERAAPDLCVLAGDEVGLEVPHKSTPAERAVFFPALVRIANVCPLVLIPGNHSHLTDLSAVAHLGGTYPIRVIFGAEVIEVDTPAGTAWVYGMAFPTKRWLLAGEDAPRGLSDARAVAEAKLAGLLTMWAARIRHRRKSNPADVHIFLGHGMVAGATTSGGEVLQVGEIEFKRDTLDALPADALCLGHIHKRQEVADRAWYPGSTWFSDHGEKPTDPKGWHLVTIAPTLAEAKRAHVPPFPTTGLTAYDAIPGERHACVLSHVTSGCRLFRTLDFRWSGIGGDGSELAATEEADGSVAPSTTAAAATSKAGPLAGPRGGWVRYPTPAEIAACADAEVRMRLTVPEAWASTVPWADAVAAVRKAGAHRIAEERRVEPSTRVRSPEVAAAVAPRAKLRCFWESLAAPPTPAEQAAALAVLDEMESSDDEAVRATTDAILAATDGRAAPAARSPAPAPTPTRGDAPPF